MISSRTRNCLIILMLSLMLMWISPAAATVTIRNISPTAHLAPAGTSLADLAAAIKLAADELDWRVVTEAPGVITAALLVRQRHEAVVTIGYDELNYWIDYQDSDNLDYSPDDLNKRGKLGKFVKGPRIHRNYNVWVDRLAERIAIRTRAPPRANLANTAPSGKPIRLRIQSSTCSSTRRAD